MKSKCVQYIQTLDNPANKLTTTEYFNISVAKLPIWNIADNGDCLTHVCTNLYLANLGKYIAAIEDQVVLQKDLPAGKWLLRDQHFYYLTPGNDGVWKVDESTRLLSRTNDMQLVMHHKYSAENTKHRKQLWKYTDDERILPYELSEEEEALNLAIGLKGDLAIANHP